MRINLNKKLLIFIIFFLVFCSFGQLIVSKDLEFDYPDIPGVQKPTSIYTPITVYFKYVYNFSIIMAGSLTFVLFVLGGIKYLFSTGKPEKMADARSQITNALLGFIIIFSSHLFLRTINPKLVQFPSFSWSPITNEPIDPLKLEGFKYYFIEMPIGTLITKEYTGSSFLTYPDEKDPPCDCPKYQNAFQNVEEYPGDFQGGLHGRRLKRIHEVAEMAVPLAKKMMELIDELKKLTDQCDCTNCVCQANCVPSGPSTCVNAGGQCNGEICKEETKEEIKCQQVLIEYFSGAYKAFLDDYSELVKNKDYQGNSYWYSPKAVELRAKIEECKAKGKISQEEIDEIEKLIDDSSEVENKGTQSPKTKPPERDVQTNIFHLEAIFNSLLEFKENINPYSQKFGSLDFLSWHGMIKFQAETQLTEKKTSAGSSGEVITKPHIVVGTNVNQEVKTSEDPTLFYIFDPINFEKNVDELVTSFNIIFKNKKSFFISEVLAEESDDKDELDELLQTKTKCSRMIEIPIGKTIDEALKLIEDILRELKNIWEKGHKQIKNGEEMRKLADKLMVEESCKKYCEAKCICTNPCHSTEENPCTECLACKCYCEPNAELLAIKDQINELNENTKRAYESIKESFEKLDSKKAINKDNCCSDKLGNCRNENDQLILDKIKEKKYTLKSKLVEIQKLLNRSREVVNLNREKNEGKSVYEMLIHEFLKMDPPLAEKRELTNFLADEKLDLTNCDVLYAETRAIAESKEEQKALVNCKVARGEAGDFLADPIRTEDDESCSPDPLLDCDYFNPAKERKKRPFCCYCFDEDISKKGYDAQNYRLPPTVKYDPILEGFIPANSNQERNLANNLYCCVIPYEGY